MLRPLALLLLALLAGAPTGRAQDVAGDTSRTAAARAFLRATDAQAIYRRTLTNLEQVLGQQNPGVNMGAVMRGFMERYMPWAELEQDYVALYAEAFTADELRALAAFFESDLGRVYLGRLPEVSRRVMEASQRRVVEHQAELARLIEEEVRKGRAGGG